MKTLLLNMLTIGLLASFSFEQPTSFVIKGKVTDESGSPLIGASILIKGTSSGTVTDVDGTFSLPALQKCVELECSYTGYTTISKKVCEGDGFVEIQMTASADQLSEVTVTGSRVKIITSSIASAMSIRPDKKRKSRKHRQKAEYMMSPAVSYCFPDNGRDFNTEDYSPIEENRFHRVTDEPLSTFSIDVDAASYSNLRRFIKNGQTPPADAVRIEEMINYFDYDYPAPPAEGNRPFEVVTEAAPCPWNPDNQLLLIGLQGKKVPTENLPPSNLVFLIDVSGSMQPMNKLPLLKSSLRMLVNNLRDQDRVAMAVYAGAAGLVLPSTPGTDRQKILEAIDRLQSGGSTAGAAGIKLAYEVARKNFIENGNNRVLLATDGDFNVGVSSDGELVKIIEKERESGIFLTVLGFGTGNYKDNKMQQLADHGNGNHYYIDNINEGRKVLVREFGGTLFTIAKDVKIQIEFNPAKIQGYRLIGYENRMLNKEDFNDDTKDAGELGSGHRVTALYELIPAGIQTKLLGSVDDLKYQKSKTQRSAAHSDEMLTVKLRYKQPNGHISQKIEKPVFHNILTEKGTSDNFRFAAAVAEFGLLLRDSKFKGKASYQQAADLARSALGNDQHGYRRELLDMIETMKALKGEDTRLEAEK